MVMAQACAGGTAEQKPAEPQAEDLSSATDDAMPAEVVLDASIALPDATASKGPLPSQSPECLNSCRRLLTESFDSVADAVKTECNYDWRAKDRHCYEWESLTNCIYAAGGKVFQEMEVQYEFDEFSWYTPNPKFKAKQLGKIAKANIKSLKESQLSCEKVAAAKLEIKLNKPGLPVQVLDVDLDGDGKAEHIEITTNHVVVDGESFVHKLNPRDKHAIRVKEVDIKTGDAFQELMIANYYYDTNANRRFLYKRKGVVGLSNKITWNDVGFKIDGKGEVRMSSGECGQKSLYIYAFKKDALVLKRKKVTGKYREEMCSACPYVYTWEQNDWRFRGEILRNLRAQSLEGTQLLSLGRHTGPLRVRLAERKDETTSLDFIEVIARFDDGSEQLIAPNSCSMPGLKFCGLDSQHQIIERGDEVDLVFEFEGEAEIQLRAHGYYLPY